jgi:hypothetical protein
MIACFDGNEVDLTKVIRQLLDRLQYPIFSACWRLRNKLRAASPLEREKKHRSYSDRPFRVSGNRCLIKSNASHRDTNMKTIGIIGGLSPESTAVYYKALNEGVRARTNQQHRAKIIIFSVDGGEIWQLRQKGNWAGQGKIVADAAIALERAGADFTLLAGNTMHRVADAIEAVVTRPFLHLVDATARRIKSAGITTVGLTGTSYTLTEKFYIDRLAHYGITSVIPDAGDRQK